MVAAGPSWPFLARIRARSPVSNLAPMHNGKRRGRVALVHRPAAGRQSRRRPRPRRRRRAPFIAAGPALASTGADTGGRRRGRPWPRSLASLERPAGPVSAPPAPDVAFPAPDVAAGAARRITASGAVGLPLCGGRPRRRPCLEPPRAGPAFHGAALSLTVSGFSSARSCSPSADRAPAPHVSAGAAAAFTGADTGAPGPCLASLERPARPRIRRASVYLAFPAPFIAGGPSLAFTGRISAPRRPCLEDAPARRRSRSPSASIPPAPSPSLASLSRSLEDGPAMRARRRRPRRPWPGLPLALAARPAPA